MRFSKKLGPWANEMCGDVAGSVAVRAIFNDPNLCRDPAHPASEVTFAVLTFAWGEVIGIDNKHDILMPNYDTEPIRPLADLATGGKSAPVAPESLDRPHVSSNASKPRSHASSSSPNTRPDISARIAGTNATVSGRA